VKDDSYEELDAEERRFQIKKNRYGGPSDSYSQDEFISHVHGKARKEKFRRDMEELIAEGSYQEAEELSSEKFNKYPALAAGYRACVEAHRAKKSLQESTEEALKKLGLAPEIDEETRELMEEIEDWK
jgi:hypothetical protein